MIAEKKERGVRRKLKGLIQYIKESTEQFPDSCVNDPDWELPILFTQRYLDSTKVKWSVKKKVLQTLIDQAEHLIRVRPEKLSSYKVIVMLKVAQDHSEITGSSIYIAKDLIDINEWVGESDWIDYLTPIMEKRDVIAELGLSLNVNFKITGYTEEYNFDEYLSKHELWFIVEK